MKHDVCLCVDTSVQGGVAVTCVSSNVPSSEHPHIYDHPRGQTIGLYFPVWRLAACADFRCAGGDCVATSSRCNTTNECGDGSDEVGCGKVTMPSVRTFV